ncbi:unnamed protein product, partial [Candidula unifasciata]
VHAQAKSQPPLGCEVILCPLDTVCRDVAACATCPKEAQCVPISKVDTRIDNKCQQLNYTQAILLDKKTCYRQIDCTEVSPQCPQGAACVETYNGKGICCRDQTSSTNQPAFRKEKLGVCPENILNCGRTLCESDRRCPGAQKCCPACGSKLCSEPVIKCGDGVCKPGEICVQKPYPCTPGMVCIQIVIGVCVPAGCGKCEYNEDCRETPTGYECIPPVN